MSKREDDSLRELYGWECRDAYGRWAVGEGGDCTEEELEDSLPTFEEWKEKRKDEV